MVESIPADEMSMVEQDVSGFVSLRVRQTVQERTPAANDQRESRMLGGLDLIFVGDLMQLLPAGAARM